MVNNTSRRNHNRWVDRYEVLASALGELAKVRGSPVKHIDMVSETFIY